MKKNMGTTDRVIRVLLGLVFAILYLTGTVTGIMAAVLGIVAVIFIVTAAIGFCPMYMILKISTIGKSK